MKAEEALEIARSTRIGFDDGTCLCDFCNKRLAVGERVALQIAVPPMTKEEMEARLRELARAWGARVFTTFKPGEPELMVACRSCLERIKETPEEVEVWIVESTLCYVKGKPRLKPVKAWRKGFSG